MRLLVTLGVCGFQTSPDLANLRVNALVPAEGQEGEWQMKSQDAKRGRNMNKCGVGSHLGTQVGMFRWEALMMGALRTHRTSGAG